MKNFTKRISAVAIFVMSYSALNAAAQCMISNPSGNSVTFNITPVSIIKPSSCSSGYSYSVSINYTITASAGTSFYGADATFKCDNDPSTGFHMSALGSGSVNSYTTSTNKTNCATATPTNMLCGSLNLYNVNINGVNYTSPCSFAPAGTPLSVKLLNFDAAIRNGKVAINWTTAAEVGSTYFILERSNNAKDWEAITKMDGSGTEHVKNSYNYTDNMPEAGMNYYRLKEVEGNGDANYSKVLGVEAANTDRKVSMYPNPNNGESIQFSGLQNAADWSVKVLSTTSAVVYQSSAISETVALPALPAGLYYVQLHNSKTGKTEVMKLMRK